MFAAVRRLVRVEPTPYARQVAAELLREGFDPSALDEMKTLGSFTQGSRIFRILADQKLKPVDAAFALRMACNLYQRSRRVAEANGWPLRDPRAQAPAQPRHEAYFVELLLEAARVLKLQQ
jgi:hypothetical protein